MNYPEGSIQHSEHGESLKWRIWYDIYVNCSWVDTRWQ